MGLSRGSSSVLALVYTLFDAAWCGFFAVALVAAAWATTVEADGTVRVLHSLSLFLCVYFFMKFCCWYCCCYCCCRRRCRHLASAFGRLRKCGFRAVVVEVVVNIVEDADVTRVDVSRLVRRACRGAAVVRAC